MNEAIGQSINSREKDERELLVRVASGDRDAIAELYRIYQPRLFKFVFRLTQSYTESDELVNDIMLIVWRKADTFRRDSKVSTWIFGIAYRQSLQRLSKRQLRVLPDAEPDDFPAEERNRIENEDWVQHGLRHLPPAQKLATILVFYVGMSYEEIAEVSDCPVNTVKTRMFHARRKLKESLAASRDVTDFDETCNE